MIGPTNRKLITNNSDNRFIIEVIFLVKMPIVKSPVSQMWIMCVFAVFLGLVLDCLLEETSRQMNYFLTFYKPNK